MAYAPEGAFVTTVLQTRCWFPLDITNERGCIFTTSETTFCTASLPRKMREDQDNTRALSHPLAHLVCYFCCSLKDRGSVAVLSSLSSPVSVGIAHKQTG